MLQIRFTQCTSVVIGRARTKVSISAVIIENSSPKWEDMQKMTENRDSLSGEKRTRTEVLVDNASKRTHFFQEKHLF